MFSRLASDALGLSDIGLIISPKDFNKVDSDDYIMHEDDEKIFFLIKSKTDEYCFTNFGLIHVDGNSAISKKRTVVRYDFIEHSISNVTIETAGNIDLDCEIKFTIGGKAFSIDVDKNQIEPLKDLYKTLVKIGKLQKEGMIFYENSMKSLNVAATACGSAKLNSNETFESFRVINEYVFDWMKKSKAQYILKDFSHVYKNYINN